MSENLNSSEDFPIRLLDSPRALCYKPSDGQLTDRLTMAPSLQDVARRSIVHLNRLLGIHEAH